MYSPTTYQAGAHDAAIPRTRSRALVTKLLRPLGRESYISELGKAVCCRRLSPTENSKRQAPLYELTNTIAEAEVMFARTAGTTLCESPWRPSGSGCPASSAEMWRIFVSSTPKCVIHPHAVRCQALVLL